jgi:hypothetical protein
LDLGWADESEVERVEGDQDVLALEGVEADFFEGFGGLAPGLAFEIWGCLLHDCFHLFLDIFFIFEKVLGLYKEILGLFLELAFFVLKK